MHYSSADVSPFHRILYKVIYQVLRNPAKKKTVPKHDLLRAGNNNKNNNNTADYFLHYFWPSNINIYPLPYHNLTKVL